jgi:hypothetical protein
MQSAVLRSQQITAPLSRITSRSDFPSIGEDQVKQDSPVDNRPTRVLGGTLAVGIVAPALLRALSITTSSVIAFVPLSLAVVAGTLVANGIRDLIANLLKQANGIRYQ